MAEPIDERERRELCDLLMELGPDAPTLCAGWTTADLAAHLVLRAHFKRWPDEARAEEKAKGFPDLVARLRAGPPLVPWRLPKLRTLLNGPEYFIHHEDARRANGMPRRADRADLEDLAWRTVRFAARRTARQARPYGLRLHAAGRPVGKIGSPPYAILTGEPTELLLFVSGRRDAAQVTIEGDAEAIAALEAQASGL